MASLRVLDELCAQALAQGVGSAIAVSVGDGATECFRSCYGHHWRVPALGPPVTEASWFDLASLTKPMVSAACAMALVEQGRLDLGAPVRRWLGDAATSGTVAELLGHAAGAAPHVRFFDSLARHTLEGESPRAALLRLARRHPLEYAPGSKTVYSDLGYLALGELLERVAEEPLDALFAREVAGPLGLGARYVGASAALAPCVATEVEQGVAVCGRVHDENARAGGGVFGHAGLFGRIGDVARLAAALVSPGAGWVRQATRERFFSHAAGPGSWRLGWDTPSETPGVSHAGDVWPRRGAVGHLGFTGVSIWLALPTRRWVVLLTNRVHPSRDGSAEPIKQLRRAVMDAAWLALEG